MTLHFSPNMNISTVSTPYETLPGRNMKGTNRAMRDRNPAIPSTTNVTEAKREKSKILKMTLVRAVGQQRILLSSSSSAMSSMGGS